MHKRSKRAPFRQRLAKKHVPFIVSCIFVGCIEQVEVSRQVKDSDLADYALTRKSTIAGE